MVMVVTTPSEMLSLSRPRLVFKSPVRSGLFAFFEKTRTGLVQD